MKMFSALVLVSGFVASIAFAAASKPVLSFTDLRILTPVRGATVTAAYGTIKNESDKEVTVTIADAAPFKAVELHETVDKGGKMGMQRLEKVVIPAHASFELKPGANHIMLFEPTKEVKTGEELTVNFSVDGKVQAAKVKVAARNSQTTTH